MSAVSYHDLPHTHTHTHTYIYIYIYRERERERDKDKLQREYPSFAIENEIGELR